MVGEKLLREQGAGSGEQGFHLQIFWNFDNHGEANLLPWIINVWTFVTTQDRVIPYYAPNSSIKHSKSDSQDRSLKIL
jgi:hypothetical protein